MSITAISEAPLAIQFHVAFALPAALLGPVALLRRRRDLLHRITGRLWILAMLGLAVSSFFVHSIRLIGPFSPIHLLSITTLAGLAYGFRAALRRDFITHGRTMRALYLQALIGAGVFTFLPGRRMNALFGAENPQLVFWIAASCGLALAALIWFHPTRPRIPLFNTRA